MTTPAFQNIMQFEQDVPLDTGYVKVVKADEAVKGTYFDVTTLLKGRSGWLRYADADSITPQSLIVYTASEVYAGGTGTVTTAQLADGTIAAVDIASGAISTSVGTLSGSLDGTIASPLIRVDPTSTGLTITQGVDGIKFVIDIGVSGYSGATGASGFSGKSGWSGFSGESGWSGFSGISGWSGFSGA